jgi:hypothetical protein
MYHGVVRVTKRMELNGIGPGLYTGHIRPDFWKEIFPHQRAAI